MVWLIFFSDSYIDRGGPC
uniref:Uncharacterized protein n=1 Tax=Anguilla anguilla TaxID=7936 RepID=A0A0E9R7Y0_ANGAN